MRSANSSLAGEGIFIRVSCRCVPLGVPALTLLSLRPRDSGSIALLRLVGGILAAREDDIRPLAVGNRDREGASALVDERAPCEQQVRPLQHQRLAVVG